MKSVIVGRDGGTSAPIIGWKDKQAGYRVVGRMVRFREGQYGPLGDLEDPLVGPITVAMPAALRADLMRVRIGAEVEILYKGLQLNAKTGRSFHSFTVSVDSEADLLPPGEAPSVSTPVDPPAVTRKAAAW